MGSSALSSRTQLCRNVPIEIASIVSARVRLSKRVACLNHSITRLTGNVAAPRSSVSRFHPVSATLVASSSEFKIAAEIPQEEISKHREFIRELLRFLHFVPAEFIAHDGQKPVCERFLIAGAKAFHEGESNDWRRETLLNGFLDGPAALAGVANI